MEIVDLAQDLIVTLVAGGALTLVARRALGFARATTAAPKCAGCASAACAPPATASDAGRSVEHPLTFVRSSR